MRGWIALGCAAALASCSSFEDKGAAEKQIAVFHQAYSAGQFARIYRTAAPAFRKTAPEPKLVAFLGAVHRKLGAVKSSDQQNWRADYGTGGNRVTLIYKTTFAGGDGVETFVYEAGPTPHLLGYHIASDALVLQ